MEFWDVASLAMVIRMKFALAGCFLNRRGMVLEPTRQDQDRVVGLKLHQVLSAAFVAISMVTVAVVWLSAPRP